MTERGIGKGKCLKSVLIVLDSRENNDGAHAQRDC